MAEEAVIKTPPSHEEVFQKLERSERATGQIIPTEEKAPEQQTAPEVKPEEKIEVKPEEKPIPEEKVVVKSADELTDEELEELYSKRLGKKPVEKVLTAAEKEELEKAETAESIAWALTNKKIDKDFYDKSIADRTKDKREIALSLFTAEAQAEDKSLTADDCEQMFADYYAEEEPADSWKRKKAIKEMNAVADNYLAQYNTIDGITEEYRTFKTTTENHKNYNKSVSAIAKEIPAELSFSIPYEGVGGTKETLEYKIPVDEKIVQALVREFTKPELAESWMNAKPEVIAGEMNYHVRARMMDKVISELLVKHGDKVATDIMVNLKNARNPQQPIIGQQPAASTATKAPPSHDEVLKRVK